MKKLQLFVKKYADYLIIFLAFVVGLYLDLPLKKISFLLVLCWAVLNPISARMAAKIVIFISFIIPVLIAFNKVDLAEQTAIGLFFGFLYLIAWRVIAKKV